MTFLIAMGKDLSASLTTLCGDIPLCVCACTHMCARASTHAHVCTHVHCIRMQTCTFGCVWMLSVCVCVYTCVSVCACVHTHLLRQRMYKIGIEHFSPGTCNETHFGA